MLSKTRFEPRTSRLYITSKVWVGIPVWTTVFFMSEKMLLFITVQYLKKLDGHSVWNITQKVSFYDFAHFCVKIQIFDKLEKKIFKWDIFGNFQTLLRWVSFISFPYSRIMVYGYQDTLWTQQCMKFTKMYQLNFHAKNATLQNETFWRIFKPLWNVGM